MKIEVLPKEGGFVVLFLDADPATVAKVKGFFIALLSGMGYSLEVSKVEKGDNFLFFNITSVDDRKLRANDLFYALDKTTTYYT